MLNYKHSKKYLEEKILTIPQTTIVLSFRVIGYYQ